MHVFIRNLFIGAVFVSLISPLGAFGGGESPPSDEEKLQVVLKRAEARRKANKEVARDNKTAARLEAEFRDKYGEEWKFDYRREGVNLPSSILFGKTLPYRGTKEKISRDFIEENREFLGLPKGKVTTLAHHRTRGNPHSVQRIHWQQEYRGIPVFNAFIQVWVHKNKRITGIINSAWPVEEVDISPTLSAQDLLAIIEKDVQPFTLVELHREPTLIIFKEGRGRLAYLVSAAVKHPAIKRPRRWLYRMDAHTGEILEVSREQWWDNPKMHELYEKGELMDQPADAPSGPDTQAGAAPDCTLSWSTPGALPVTEIGFPLDPSFVEIELGNDRAGDLVDSGQAGGTRGAGTRLLPGINYDLRFDWDLQTWDSYHTDLFWDIIFLNINNTAFKFGAGSGFGTSTEASTNFPSVSCNTASSNKTFMPGWSWWWGGHDPQVWCAQSGIFNQLHYEDDLSKTSYLTAGIKTGTVYPTWGTIQVLITGETVIFDPNPVNTLNNLNIALTDMNDARDAVPLEAYSVVSLGNLDNPGPGRVLPIERPMGRDAGHKRESGIPGRGVSRPAGLFRLRGRHGVLPHR